MRIQVLGETAQTASACLVIEVGDQKILVDPGLSLGENPFELLQLKETGDVTAIVITHAHADHAGALPVAAQLFPDAQILATQATLALLQTVLHHSPHLTAVLDAQACEGETSLVARGKPLLFGEPYPIPSKTATPERIWWLTLYRAGHVLGAAMALLHTPEGTVLISGDISRSAQRTVRRALAPRNQNIDVLVLESTFGDRGYRPPEAEEMLIVAQVKAALARGGHVLIACSAIGTAQEILVILLAARLRREILADIWTDGTVREVNAVYATYAPPEHPGLAQFVKDHGNPFIPKDGLVRAVETPLERQSRLEGPPAIIVTNSPTLQTGPSAYYAVHLTRRPEHLILLPAQELRPAILRDPAVQCVMSGYSLTAHAVGDELAKVALQIRARCIVLVHGSRESRKALAARLRSAGHHCVVPESTGIPISQIP